MADSTELMRAYVVADKRYREDQSRYFPVWPLGAPPPPTPEGVTEEVLLRLKKLGEEAEATRQAWMSAMEDEQRERRRSN